MKKILSVVLCLLFLAVGVFVLYERFSGEVIFEKVIYDQKTFTIPPKEDIEILSISVEPISLELSPEMNPIKIYFNYKYIAPIRKRKTNHYTMTLTSPGGSEVVNSNVTLKLKVSDDERGADPIGCRESSQAAVSRRFGAFWPPERR